jgi:hypothetical protein
MERIDQVIGDFRALAENYSGTPAAQGQLQIVEWLEELKRRRNDVASLTAVLARKNPAGMRIYLDGPVEPVEVTPPVKEAGDGGRLACVEELLFRTARQVSLMSHGASTPSDVFEFDELVQRFCSRMESEHTDGL